MIHKIKNRIERLIITVISKQWLVFLIGTILLWNKCITPEVWVVLAGIVIGSNVAQKIAGLAPMEKEGF